MALPLQLRPVEIRLPDVDLVQKLSVLGAALAAIREAHRDDMSARTWAEINQAEEHLAAAIFYRNDGRQLENGR